MITVLTWKANPSFKTIGKLKPIGAKKKYDDLWGGEYTYFTKTAEFRQKIKVLAANPVIKGTYEGQVCTEKDGKCIPVNGDFEVVGLTVAGAEKGAIATPTTPEATKSDTTSSNPETVDTATKTAVATTTPSDTGKVNKASILPKEEKKEDESIFGFFLLAMGAGFLALLTPCVFPLIPMTVTFFTKRSGTRAQGIRNAFLYGFSIIAIYVIAGTIVAKVNGPGFANFLATHWFPNILFTVIFVIFGLSFLGLFEIVLPSSMVNKVDRMGDKGGFIGIFFMAFTLVLVSFSCTGPIVGSILVESAGGAFLKPIVGMFGFSLALSLPFMFFALFPQALSELPKSGGWLNSVKVVLGFTELALALKYLSTADLSYHWGLLNRDTYLSIWIVIFALIGFYLLGKIRMPKDDKLEKIPVFRMVLAIVVFSFTVYLIPGLWGAPLPALSGYLPPQSTQPFTLTPGGGSGGHSANYPLTGPCSTPKYADFLHVPHNIPGYFDYKQAVACAKQQNKPLFIDFTGHGCVNCREMEASVWSNPEVLRRLKEDFVVVSLYVDDKKELPEADWYTSTYDKKVKKSIGEQNADFQIVKYKTNSQPLYVIVDAEGEQLNATRAYDKNVDAYIKFLDEAKLKFKQTKR
jgi:thiol:disulfide interchange protein DsbD